MPYVEEVIESLGGSNSFRVLVRDILLESIKSQDVQKAITDSLKDYAPFHNFIAESVAESKQKARGKFFSYFSKFGLEQVVAGAILCTVTFLLGFLYSSRGASNNHESIPLVSEATPEPKLKKDAIK